MTYNEKIISPEKKLFSLEWDANFSRTGKMEIKKGTCLVCSKENVEVLSIDPSESEYTPGSICKECVINAFG
jgi:hypothetical protein